MTVCTDLHDSHLSPTRHSTRHGSCHYRRRTHLCLERIAPVGLGNA